MHPPEVLPDTRPPCDVIALPGDALSALEASGAELAVVFGSTAVGQARADSDLDIGVSFSPGAKPTLQVHLALAVALERFLGREVDLVVLDEATPLLRYEAARGKRLWERQPGAFASFVARAVLEFDDLRPVLLRCGWGMLRRLSVGA